MVLFLTVLGFWVLALGGAKSLHRIWRRWHSLQPARYISEIQSVDYYQQLSPSQFESLVLQGTWAHQFTVFGNPFLSRTKDQGYAWKKGKRAVLSCLPEHPLTEGELSYIARKSNAARAERAIVFSPYSEAPDTSHVDIEVLAGKKLLSWFSVLDDVVPPLPGRAKAETCQCGAPMKDRVSRSGHPLLVCSLYPDCRGIREVPSELVEAPSLAASKAVKIPERARERSLNLTPTRMAG